ncbi:P4Hc [Musa troglodytarum]|uniref:P4Hc n=1 Tax=Musa troglodytarum TaxID=320322 RepID=A0A9E7FQX3_9LILI|nr:P4Hc [Musa troglodytarum]
MARGARHPRRPPTLILVALLTISVVLLVLLALGAFSLPAVSKDGRVAEVRRSVRESRYELQEIGEPWMEVLSWGPRAFLYHNFLNTFLRDSNLG